MRFQRGSPGFVVEIHALGWNRLVGRRAKGLLLERGKPRVVVLGNLLKAARHRLFGEVIEAHGHARQIVEQRLQVVVEQRQPVLLARVALPRADGLVERIVAGRAAKQLHVAAAEELLRLLAECDLAHRQQRELLHGLRRALRLHLEGLDRLQRIAEEIEAHRRRTAWREEIEDAAAHREFAGLHDGAAALVAHEAEPLRELAHIDALARRDRLDRPLQECARRHALQDGIDRRQHHGGVLARAQAQLGERRDALGHDVSVGADAVVGHRVPGGNGDDAHLRREEGERALERIEAAVIARDMQKRARCRCMAGFGGKLREHERVEPFRDAGDDAFAMRFRLGFARAHAWSGPSAGMPASP